MSENEQGNSKKLELVMIILVAFFAAVLAINDVGAGRYGDDEKFAFENSAQQNNWYQAKSIKKTIYEGQIDLLRAMDEAKVIKPEYKAAIDAHITKTEADIKRYKKEMAEIQNGSNAVGKENWIQEDSTHKLGNITGAKEYARTAALLGDAGDKYDLATVFLQLGLVLGAIGLVLQSDSQKKVFLFLMLGLGLLGMFHTIQGYLLAWSA